MHHEIIRAPHFSCPCILTTSTENSFSRNIVQKWHDFSSSPATHYLQIIYNSLFSLLNLPLVSMGTYFCEDSQTMRKRYFAHGKGRSSGPKSSCIAHKHIHCAVNITIQYGFFVTETYKWPYCMKRNIAPSLKWSKANYSRKGKNSAKIDLVTLISHCLGENI